MIRQELNKHAEQLKSFTVAQFTDQLRNAYYPRLLSQLHLLELMLQEVKSAANTAGLLLVQKIKQELESIRQKEQIMIFPVLTILEQEHRTTDCGLFKLSKMNYTSALFSMQQLKSMLSAHEQENAIQVLAQAKEAEADFIHLQKAKEKYLFSRFKSCEGNCKAYEQK